VSDFGQILRDLNEEGVEYVLVGGIADIADLEAAHGDLPTAGS
jgi:hypothetical protein